MTGLIMVAGALLAQGLFARTYGANSFDQTSKVIQTGDGGYILIGYSISFTSSYDAMILKLSPTGSLEWTKTYGGSAEDASFGIAEGNDGNYFVLTRTRSYGVGNIDVLVTKFAPDGSLLWPKTYGWDLLEMPWSICAVPDGGAVIVGGTNSFDPYSMLIFKINSGGSLVWARAATVAGKDGSEAYSIASTADKGFAIAGIGVTTDYQTDSMDVIFVKTDSTGKTQWARALRGNKYDWGLSVIQTPDHGFVVAGATPSSGEGGTDILVFKMDSAGSLEWAKTYGTSGEEMGYSIIQTSDTGYMVSAKLGYDDIGVLKISSDGSLEWAKTIQGTGWDAGRSIIPTSDGYYLITGETGSFGGAGQYDAFAIKLSQDGYPGCLQNITLFEATAAMIFDTIDMLDTLVNLTTTSPTITPVSRTLTTHDICPPSVEEGDRNHTPAITCCWDCRGAKFVSSLECPIYIYNPDGRLAYSGLLRKGENRISLERGVYLWRAGGYRGKAVVR